MNRQLYMRNVRWDNIHIPSVCLGIVCAVLVWSGISPYNYVTWAQEVLPVVIAVPLLLLTYKKFRLTNLLYVLIAIHCVILLIGGHYSYARVPGLEWMNVIAGATRNSFDGVGHFAQGFVPAIVARELLLRTSPLASGKWLFALIIFSCLGISALYELIEWVVAIYSGESAEDFLGTQGDEWDTQKDMALALLGAVIALLSLSKIHDKQLAQQK